MSDGRNGGFHAIGYDWEESRIVFITLWNEGSWQRSQVTTKPQSYDANNNDFLCVLSVVYDFLGAEVNSNLTLYFGWLRYVWWMVSGDRIMLLGQSPIGRFKPYVGCPNGRGAGSDGATLRLSLEPATRGIFVFEQKKTWIVFQIAFFSEKQRGKTLPIHVLDLKEYYAKFSFLLKTLDNLRTCVLCSMWCFENPFNSGQRTLECCQAGSIDGNVNGLGSFFLATSKMTLGSLDVGQFNFLSAKDGQIHQPPERPDPVASATQSFN